MLAEFRCRDVAGCLAHSLLGENSPDKKDREGIGTSLRLESFNLLCFCFLFVVRRGVPAEEEAAIGDERAARLLCEALAYLTLAGE